MSNFEALFHSKMDASESENDEFYSDDDYVTDSVQETDSDGESDEENCPQRAQR